MIQFAEVFPNEGIVVSLIRQLSWTHFIALLPLKNRLQRDFYAELCGVEGWSVSTLRQKIDSMLFERTAVSRKPEKLARKELDALRADNKWAPDIALLRLDQSGIRVGQYLNLAEPESSTISR